MGKLYESISELLLQRLEPPVFPEGPSAPPPEDAGETPQEDAANQTAEELGPISGSLDGQALAGLRLRACSQIENQLQRKEVWRAYTYVPKAVPDAKKTEDD